MTPARPKEKQRQACNQSESNGPEETVYRFSSGGGAEGKQTQEGNKNNPRVNSPNHKTPLLDGALPARL